MVLHLLAQSAAEGGGVEINLGVIAVVLIIIVAAVLYFRRRR